MVGAVTCLFSSISKLELLTIFQLTSKVVWGYSDFAHKWQRSGG